MTACDWRLRHGCTPPPGHPSLTGRLTHVFDITTNVRVALFLGLGLWGLWGGDLDGTFKPNKTPAIIPRCWRMYVAAALKIDIAAVSHGGGGTTMPAHKNQ